MQPRASMTASKFLRRRRFGGAADGGDIAPRNRHEAAGPYVAPRIDRHHVAVRDQDARHACCHSRAGNAMMRGRASTDKSLESPDTVGLLEEGRIYDTSERNEQAILA